MQAEAQAEAGMWALYLVKAHVRDDGENSRRDTGDIGLHIYDANSFHHNVRMYGPHFTGVDEGDGSQKYEWYDDETVCYEHFLLLNGSNLDGMGCIRILAIEGDESNWHGIPIPDIASLAADDTVFKADICQRQLGSNQVVRIEGSCDIPGRCATLWLRFDPNWNGRNTDVVLPPKPCP